MDYLISLERNYKEYIKSLDPLNDIINQDSDGLATIAQLQEQLIINLLITYKM